MMGGILMIRISFVALTTFFNSLAYIASRHGISLNWEPTIRILSITSGIMLVSGAIIKYLLSIHLGKDNLSVNCWADALSFVVAVVIFQVLNLF